jgi:hypothetical protein
LFLGSAGALLNAPDQLILLAFDVLKVVVGEMSELLFDFALHDIPVPLQLERIHRTPSSFSFVYSDATQRAFRLLLRKDRAVFVLMAHVVAPEH